MPEGIADPPVQPDTPPSTPPPELPAWATDVPEKLRRDTPEATLAELTKAHKSLESMVGQKPPAEVTPTKPGELAIAPAKAETPGDEDIAAVLKKVGLDGEQLSASWETNGGKLTEDQYRAFHLKGYSKPLVNQLMRGQAAIAQLAQMQAATVTAEAAKIAGGPEKLASIREWAANGGIPADKLHKLGAMVDETRGGSMDNYPEYISLIVTAHAKAIGADKSSPVITGQPGTPSNGTPTTKQEFAKLMVSVNEGDPAAMNTLNKMSQADIEKFSE